MNKTVFNWGHNRRFNDYSSYIKKKYGKRVQKISVNIGVSCPNRDGFKGVGGCIYCDNKTFKPGYCEPEIPVKQQIEKGVGFFEKKYPDMSYMAYFQSYTNTYAPLDYLRKVYTEAISQPKIIGLIIGTRPDCINDEILTMLKELSEKVDVMLEFGIESTIDKTLMEINRCHTWQDSKNAINLCNKYGFDVGIHLILGLPGETENQILEHAKKISELPIKTLKLHQLQVIKDTLLAKKYKDNPNYVKLYNYEEYIKLSIKFIELLNPNIVIERFVSVSPIDKLIAPKWNKIKNFEIVAMIDKELDQQNTFQGRCYNKG
jgi:radical SAM protein (TIGR01212 family)